MLISILTLVFYIIMLIMLKQIKSDWIEQPGIKFFTNFYFSKFFGSRLLGIIHLFILIFLLFYLWKKKLKKTKK